VDDLSLWTVQEYARLPAGRGGDSGRWGTWWGRVGGGPPLVRPQCVVPAVVGKPFLQAWRRLVGAHCRLGSVRRVRSKRHGRVLRQHPAAGKQLRSDARVNLTVGRR
jgi:PASTA domain-containing protein